MQAQILEAQVRFQSQPLVKPLRISAGEIRETTEARAAVRVRVNGQEATGFGTIYLSDLWAWPDPNRTHAERDAAMRALCEAIAANLTDYCGGEAAHPTELGLRLHARVCHAPGPDDPPPLAAAICASPFDAALHDAAGKALGQSAFAFYQEPVPLPSADSYFQGGSAAAAIARTLRPPVLALDAWLIVGYGDSLTEEVAPWIQNRGYRAFKLKLLGKDNAADAARAVEVYRGVRELGARSPRLAADTNCANPDTDSVLDFLERLEAADPEAYAALEYLEQPTGRDIKIHRFDWRSVTRRKPVVLDEGLTGLEIMEEAAAQGWSGFALKTCKGHSVALTVAAWAQEQGMCLAMQDLTNPGVAAMHAALLAAHLPVFNGVELNSPQFTPAANTDYLPRWSGLLDPTGGVHRLPETIPPGLGAI